LKLPSWFPAITRPDITLRDVHIYGGLVVAGIGGWQLSPAWTGVVLGVALTGMGVFARRLGGKGS
jgi:hypothetical protein